MPLNVAQSLGDPRFVTVGAVFVFLFFVFSYETINAHVAIQSLTALAFHWIFDDVPADHAKEVLWYGLFGN
jgi:hypothetical protein